MGDYVMTMAHRLGHWIQPAEPSAMKDMNTTPLIDVMLVLLIMFIITLPATTHAVKIELPNPDCAITNSCHLKSNPDFNTINIAANNLVSWNGAPVSLQQLKATLVESQKLDPVPELRLHPDADARHEMVLLVIRETKYAKVRNMGIIGNEDYTGY
jgi:biopolymer transport protein ExbD